MKKSILFNSAKISLGCVVAIIISTLLNLKYGLTAGLLTVLSIQDTKRETLKTALKRLYAFFFAFAVSVICFKIMGYNALSFGVYLFIFVNICFIMDWKIAIVPVSVLVTHLISEKSTDITLIINEFLLFAVGAGTGMLVNMHLHKDHEKMSVCRENLDSEIKDVLERMSFRILSADKSDYSGDCFKKLDALMFEAQKTAHENYDNNLKNPQTYDIEYLEMRKKQCSILYEMYKSIIKIETPPQQALVISDFLKKTAVEYHEKNDVKNLISDLEKLFSEMQYQPMPSERQEFENRAVLYSFMLLLKEFLYLKYEFVCKISYDFVEKEKK